MFDSCWGCLAGMTRDIGAGLLVLTLGLVSIPTGWAGFIHAAAAGWLCFVVVRGVYLYLEEGGCRCNEDPDESP